MNASNRRAVETLQLMEDTGQMSRTEVAILVAAIEAEDRRDRPLATDRDSRFGGD